jgi:hypothetical protein
MSRPSGPVAVFQAHDWSATVTVAPPGHACAAAGAGPVPLGLSGWQARPLPLPAPSPPTMVTGPHDPRLVLPGEATSPEVESFEALASPTTASDQAPTLLAPSPRHVAGAPDLPWVRIVPGNLMSSP